MILQVTVVFVFLPAIILGANRGDRCTNQWGEKATCTNIYSCKAAQDALAVANGAKLYAAGIVCGYDTEALVCCKTVADFNETLLNNVIPSESSTERQVITNTTSITDTASSVDINIATNVSALNESVQVVLELPNNNVLPADSLKPQPLGVSDPTTVSQSVDIPSRNQVTASSTEPSDDVIFTSPPFLFTSERTSVVSPVKPLDNGNINGLIDSTTITSTVPPKSTQTPDALPLQSNNTSGSSVVPDLSRFPEEPNSSAFPELPSNTIQDIPFTTPTTPRISSIFTESSILTDFTTQVHVNKVLPNRLQCGFQHDRNRIADAPIATIDEFPWVALLRYEDVYGYDAGFRCAGTLINNRHVITSAHCLATEPELLYATSVRLGEWSISNPTDCVFDYKGEECPDKLVDVGIEQKIPHPNYDSSGVNNIALIRLERKVDYTDFVRPICLPAENLEAPSEGTILTSSGWGATKYGCQEDIKTKIHLPALPNNKCSNKAYWFMRVEGQVCVDATSRKDYCKTDSGGPLMLLDEQEKPQWYLEGVIPEGFYCDRRGLLEVYTRVNKYIPWILSTLGQETS